MQAGPREYPEELVPSPFSSYIYPPSSLYPGLGLFLHQLFAVVALSSLLPPPATMSKTFSQNEVSSQGKGGNLWVIIEEDVYDLTKFQDEHPGKFSRSSPALRYW